jgi:hypothetical protein
MKGTITFGSNIQKALWDNEITGQLSDGYWENAKPGDHWIFWCNLNSAVGKPGVDKGSDYPLRVNYNLVNPDLLDIIGDRMIAIAKMAHLTSNPAYLKAAEYLTGYKSIDEVRKDITSYGKNYINAIPDHILEKFFTVPYSETQLKNDLKAIAQTMKMVNTPYGQQIVTDKDIQRIKDIIVKADGNKFKEQALTQMMANSIDNPFKALARAEAAGKLGKVPMARIFLNRAKQLGATQEQIKELEPPITGIEELEEEPEEENIEAMRIAAEAVDMAGFLLKEYIVEEDEETKNT